MNLEKLFHLKEHHTDVKTEVIAGITTFMTMAYILAVNPNILQASGMDSFRRDFSKYAAYDIVKAEANREWAQNIKKDEMFIDFLGDKCGARLTYGGKFEIYDGATLETIQPEYAIPDMYLCEDRAFIESVKTGEKNRGYIDNILETAKLLDALYRSADKKEEVSL